MAAERLNVVERSQPSCDRPAMPVGPIPFRYTGGALSAAPRTAAEQQQPQQQQQQQPQLQPQLQQQQQGATAQGHISSSGGSQTISEDLLRMFEESTLSDVEVVCTAGVGCKLRAHRLVLAARSPVFKAMFLTGMREKRIGKVVIEDASPEAIKCMLDFAYKDECPDLDEERIFDVLKLANKYDMPGLRDICLDFMARNSRSDNSVDFLAACDSYNLTEFKHMLLSALVDNPPALHECIHGHNLDAHPDLMKQLLTLCVHRLSRSTMDRHVVKHFDGLPYRSHCYICVREVATMSKQMLGEMLFPMVQQICPEHANKITGMIIELDNFELVPLFESESALREKVEEAVVVLRAAEDSSSTAGAGEG